MSYSQLSDVSKLGPVARVSLGLTFTCLAYNILRIKRDLFFVWRHQKITWTEVKMYLELVWMKFEWMHKYLNSYIDTW